MNKKILIIDDEENICIFIKDFWQRKGAEVFSACSSEEAVKIFEKERPQICVIDIHMPFSGFNGLEVLRRIKSIDKTVVCIMVTRVDDTWHQKEVARFGAEEYLIKPVEIEQLEKIIEKYN